MPQHSHSYSGTTTYDQGHIHHYGGITSKAPSRVPHDHRMKGVTTFNRDHDHSYTTKTSPAINLADGRHYHYFQTSVELKDGHIHYINGYTSAD